MGAVGYAVWGLVLVWGCVDGVVLERVELEGRQQNGKRERQQAINASRLAARDKELDPALHFN